MKAPKIILLGLLTLVFKDITLYSDVRLVTQILNQTSRVEDLVMQSGRRGHIVYEGELIGEPSALMQMLEESLGGRLKMEPVVDGENLTITFYPAVSSL